MMSRNSTEDEFDVMKIGSIMGNIISVTTGKDINISKNINKFKSK